LSDPLTTKSRELVAEAVARGPLLLPPRNAWLELGLFVLAIVAVDWTIPTFDLLRVEPNPCWLPVLLLSVQYGTVSGLLAAATCIGLSIHSGFPEQEIGENLFVYLLRVWAQPMLWIAVAVLLGQFRTRHIMERAELKQELAAMTSQRTALADYARNLRQRCDVLERHIAGGGNSEPVGVLAILSRLGSDSQGDVRDVFRTCMAAVLPDARVTLWRLGPAGLEPLASTRDEAASAQMRLETSSALVRELIERKAPLSVLTAAGERTLGGHAVMAVPIEAGEEMAGAILVHEIEPHLLTEALGDALTVIASALAPSVAEGRPGPATAAASDGDVGGTAETSLAPIKRLWRPRKRSETPGAPGGGPTRSQASPRRMLR